MASCVQTHFWCKYVILRHSQTTFNHIFKLVHSVELKMILAHTRTSNTLGHAVVCADIT